MRRMENRDAFHFSAASPTVWHVRCTHERSLLRRPGNLTRKLRHDAPRSQKWGGEFRRSPPAVLQLRRGGPCLQELPVLPTRLLRVFVVRCASAKERAAQKNRRLPSPAPHCAAVVFPSLPIPVATSLRRLSWSLPFSRLRTAFSAPGKLKTAASEG